MCGSPHRSRAVHGMMRDQVVVATRGLVELFVLLETAVLPRAHKGGFLQFSLAVVAREGLPATIPPLSRRSPRRENRHRGKGPI